MPIDECTSTFAELASTVLPRYMVAMRAAMRNPRQLTEFCKPRVGVQTILAGLGETEDFSGCYVLFRDGAPLYVGISRGVVGRLRQQVTGSTHFDASLAYLMACDRVPHDITREAAMKVLAFRQAFNEAKEFLQGSTVAFVKIPNPLEL
jgi:hypothetical protein